MQEKLHDLQKTFFEDRISMLEEENDKLQRNAGTEQQQIANYQQMQKLYHDRAAQYRKQGFADDSPEIRELSKNGGTCTIKSMIYVHKCSIIILMISTMLLI